MMGPAYPNPDSSSQAASITYDDYKKIDDAIRREDQSFLETLVGEPTRIVNLSRDPLISVLIRCRKSDLAVKLVMKMTSLEGLKAKNFEGDTALHVAAAEGDIREARAILHHANANQVTSEFVEARNNENETSLHKAVKYGKEDIFWMLVEEYGSDVDARGFDGSSILHYAIMCGWFGLAFDIAQNYKELALKRNEAALTHLQIMVTTQAFRSMTHLGPLESLIYNLIPLEEKTLTQHEGDEEASMRPPRSHQVDGQQSVSTSLRRFPPQYDTCFNLLKLTCTSVKWVRLLVFSILKQLFGRIGELETLKKDHKLAMKLIAYLAYYPDYWEFIEMGTKKSDAVEAKKTNSQQKIDPHSTSDQPPSLPVDEPPSLPGQDSTTSPKREGKENGRSAKHEFQWNESPLTLAAKMGLHEFVRKILDVYPESANYVDPEGKNVLQVAIQNGHENIVDIVESLTCKGNPVLPSWLLSRREKETKNTILHFAAAKTTTEEGASTLQMQYELQWFEKVKKLVPKDLMNSQNSETMTAQELFTKNHEKMVARSRRQLMEMGKTCSSLLAAVVFASGFSIPQNGSDQNLHKRTAFRFFSHAFVIGLSCAATSLVLFLSLLMAPYGELEFRRSLPNKYFLAVTSFFMALLCLLASFACNIYLSIYGGKTKLISLVGELIAVPVFCSIVLILRGCNFGIMPFLRGIWR